MKPPSAPQMRGDHAVKFVTATTIVKWKMPARVPFAADRSQRGEAAGAIVQELTQNMPFLTNAHS
jgi:hypothetical protein